MSERQRQRQLRRMVQWAVDQCQPGSHTPRTARNGFRRLVLQETRVALAAERGPRHHLIKAIRQQAVITWNRQANSRRPAPVPVAVVPPTPRPSFDPPMPPPQDPLPISFTYLQQIPPLSSTMGSTRVIYQVRKLRIQIGCRSSTRLKPPLITLGMATGLTPLSSQMGSCLLMAPEVGTGLAPTSLRRKLRTEVRTRETGPQTMQSLSVLSVICHLRSAWIADISCVGSAPAKYKIQCGWGSLLGGSFSVRFAGHRLGIPSLCLGLISPRSHHYGTLLDPLMRP